MNQFFHNIVKKKETIPRKQVLFLVNYKILWKKKGESGFSYQFNLNVSLTSYKYTLFMVLSLCKKLFYNIARACFLHLTCTRHRMDARPCVCWEMYHDDANRNYIRMRALCYNRQSLHLTNTYMLFSVWEKTVPEVFRTQDQGHSFFQTDRPRPVNNLFIVSHLLTRVLCNADSATRQCKSNLLFKEMKS